MRFVLGAFQVRLRLSLSVVMVLSCAGGDDSSVVDASGATAVEESSGATNTGDSGDVADDTADGGGPCGVGRVCAAPVPDGWKGPVVRRVSPEGKKPVACADPWPDAGLTFFDAYIEPGPSECSCECAVALSLTCYSGVWRHEQTEDCDTYSEFVVVNAGQCTPVDETTGSLTVNITGFGEPPCGPALSANIPPPQWGQLIQACTDAEVGEACGADGACMPAAPDGFEGGMCVFKAGDEACPADSAYLNKSVVYNGVANDSRVCVPCGCGDAAPIDCAGSVEAYGTEDCSGNVATEVEQDACGDADAVASIRVVIDAPSTCEVIAETQFVGTIDPGGVFTYCCAESSP